MKDFLGHELAIGDSVIIIAPNYRHFVVARVIAFTATKVRVAYLNNWNGGSIYRELLQTPDQLTRVDGPDLTMDLTMHLISKKS